jgi:hypothetical protein
VQKSRRNLTRLVFLTAIVYITFLALLLVILVMDDNSPQRYFTPNYFLRLIDAFAAFVVFVTFYSMMWNRTEGNTDSAIEQRSEMEPDTNELKRPLMENALDDGESEL